MNMLDRAVLYVGVLLAVILAAIGISRTGKISQELTNIKKDSLEEVLSLKRFISPPTIDFELATANPPICSASAPWALYAYGNMVTFTTQMAGHTFVVQFPQDNPPLNAGGNPVSITPGITKDASQGPYTLVNPYANQCPNQQCYYPYTVTVDGAPCLSKNPPNNSDGIVIKGGGG